MEHVQSVGFVIIQTWMCNTHDTTYYANGKYTGLIGMRHTGGSINAGYTHMGLYSSGKCSTCNGTGKYTVPKNCSHQKGAVHYY